MALLASVRPFYVPFQILYTDKNHSHHLYLCAAERYGAAISAHHPINSQGEQRPAVLASQGSRVKLSRMFLMPAMRHGMAKAFVSCCCIVTVRAAEKFVRLVKRSHVGHDILYGAVQTVSANHYFFGACYALETAD